MGHWRILHPVWSFVCLLASIRPVCVVWVLTGSPGSSRGGLAGWVVWEGWRVAEGLQWQVEVSCHGGGRPNCLPPGRCWLSLGLSRQPPRGPSVARQCCWEGQQSGPGRGGQRADGVLPLTMSVQWPNGWKRRRPCSHPAQLFDVLGRGVVFLQVYK